MKDYPSLKNHPQFPGRVWYIAGVFTLILVMLLFLKTIFPVLLLILAAISLVSSFQSTPDLLKTTTSWKLRLALLLWPISTQTGMRLIFWLLAASVQMQIVKLPDLMPTSLEAAREQIAKYRF